MKTRAVSAPPALAAAVAIVPFAALALLTSPYMMAATFSYLTLCLGIFAGRVSRSLHGRLMAAGVLLDLGLVVTLELQRSAVQTAASFHLDAWQQAHVYFSSVAAALYLPLLALGVLAHRRPGRAALPGWHRQLGWIAFGCRTIGFLLMFSMLERVKQP